MVAYSFKARFIDPIRVGLGLLKACPPDAVPRPKRQTIRAIGKRRHARPGETLQLYSGMRTRSCQKIGDARCSEVRDIHIAFGTARDVIRIYGDTLIQIDDIHDLDRFAADDGFKSWDAMLAFWSDEHPGVRDFHGVIIKWEPFS